MKRGPVFAQKLTFSAGLRGPRITVFGLIILFAALPGLAQSDADVHVQPGASSKKQLETQSSQKADGQGGRGGHGKAVIANVDLVLVPVTVTDPMNRAMIGLEKQNFQVYEDGEQQVIRNVSSEDAPLCLGVIFDTSKSMGNKMEMARESVVDFFKTANPLDNFFIVTFSDRPELLVDFTTSIESIRNRLVYALPHGHTSLLDAIYMGLSKVRHCEYQRRALLIVSDGGDNRSRYTQPEIKRGVDEADVQLYGIGIFDSVFQTPEERAGKQLLDSITQATGGRTFPIKDARDLPEAASSISLELRNQYVIAYRSSNLARNGRWRKIKVKLIPPEGMPMLRVYAKSGYYSATE